MFSRKISPIIACSLLLIGISGCAANRESVFQSIESVAKLAIVKNPSGLSEIPFEAGDTVMIYTKSKINISSWNVSMVRMDITEVNTTKIMGKVKFVCCDYEYGKEDVADEIVEVIVDNIATIRLVDEQIVEEQDSEVVAQIKRDAKKFVKRLPLVPFEAALRAISLVIFIKLLQLI